MADVITNAPVEQGSAVEPQVTVSSNGVKTVSQIISQIMASGNATRYRACLVKSCRVEEEDNYTRVSVTLGNEVTGFIPDASGNYLPGNTNVIFTSGFALAACLKNNEDISWLGNIINENPAAIKVLLPGSKIDIIRQLVKAGEEYVNPFTTKASEDVVPTVFDHDTYVTHIVGIELGKNGSRFADMLAMKVMGF
jgi:hypothetical protein